ncbi:formate/nitrite transporter family protein [Escherichia coli]
MQSDGLPGAVDELLRALALCDKIVAMILPITLFVASGFEHCIANLFVIPFAIAIRHFAPRPSATGAQ